MAVAEIESRNVTLVEEWSWNLPKNRYVLSFGFSSLMHVAAVSNLQFLTVSISTSLDYRVLVESSYIDLHLIKLHYDLSWCLIRYPQIWNS